MGNGVDGLHFRVGDPASLAATVGAAVATPGLWERLHAGIGEVHPMEKHAAAVTELYSSLLCEPSLVR